jgi:hypothetical protein
MPEESGWYFCLATSGSQLLESGLYVEVVNNPPPPTQPPPPRPVMTTEITTTSAASAPEIYEDRFKIYKTLEGLTLKEVIEYLKH